MRKFIENVSNIINMKNRHDQEVVNEIIKNNTNIKAAFFDLDHVFAFPSLFSIFTVQKPYVIKPIRTPFMKKKTKIEINKIGINNNFIKRVIDLYF